MQMLRYENFTEVKIHIVVLWIMILCSLVSRDHSMDMQL
jgi:hypothetical protein